jgi:hypothetical protein
VQQGRVGGFDERLLRVSAEANDGPGPGGWIVLVATGVAPEDGAGFRGKFAREGGFEFHKSVAGESIDGGGVHGQTIPV